MAYGNGVATAPFVNLQIQMGGAAAQNLTQAWAEAISAATNVGSKQVMEIGRVLEQGLRPDDLRRIHQEVGEAAQRAVVRSFDAKRNGQTRGASGYRPRDRYSGGKLRGALNDPEFFMATSDGLSFINVGLLNDRAVQWARLNFGAGPRGRGSRRSFDVVMSNMVVASFGLNEPARPGFFIPKGYFWRDGAPVRPQSPASSPGAAFYLAGTGPRRGRNSVRGADAEGATFNAMVDRQYTRGIEARNFLDAGIGVMARRLPREYLGLINNMFSTGESNVRPAPVRITVRTNSAYRRSSTTRWY